MDRQTRMAILVDHFKRPRHKHPLEGAHVRMPGGNPGCGDVVVLYVRAEAGEDRIAEVAFEGEGCTISQAAASILAHRMNRKKLSFDAVLALSYEEMIDLLGRDIVGSRPRCATLALGTLKAAVKRIETERRLSAAGKSEAEIRALLGAAHEEMEDGVGLVVGQGAVEAAAKR